MLNVSLQMGDDYPLSGCVTYFEPYMFVTSDKWISEHDGVYDGIVVNGSQGIVSVNDWSDVSTRKQMVTKFNSCLKSVIDFPKTNMMSCVLIDIITPDDVVYDDNVMTQLIEIVDELKDIFADWCIRENRVGALVPHVWQDNRYVHVHILYNRKRGEHEEFQNYLRHL